MLRDQIQNQILKRPSKHLKYDANIMLRYAKRLNVNAKGLDPIS